MKPKTVDKKYQAWKFSPAKAQTLRLSKFPSLRKFALHFEQFCKINAGQVSKYENGKERPRDDIIPYYLQALDCSFEDIFEPIFPTE